MKINGAAGEIRTPDTLVRSQVLYPAELRPHRKDKNNITSSLPELASLRLIFHDQMIHQFIIGLTLKGKMGCQQLTATSNGLLKPMSPLAITKVTAKFR